ncbi:protein aubergine-like [Aedes albopictus]|uniref:Translation initiation factor 2c eif-2c n=1 Tax=Aedes albopictus TaxID=7160 RepID=A0ABM1XWZ7_AEDAL|nr:protein aubergine-like [Aedes albopictus]
MAEYRQQRGGRGGNNYRARGNVNGSSGFPPLNGNGGHRVGYSNANGGQWKQSNGNGGNGANGNWNRESAGVYEGRKNFSSGARAGNRGQFHNGGGRDGGHQSDRLNAGYQRQLNGNQSVPNVIEKPVHVTIPEQQSSSAPSSRGGMRGNRAIAEIVRTRALDTTVSKQGCSGRQIMLQTNYFRVTRQEEECIFQYRVDLNPPVESSRLLKSLVYGLKATIGGYIFDGTQLFTRHKLRSDEVEISTKDTTTNQQYIIKLRRVGVIDGTNETALMIFNLINRKAMGGLNLQLIGRNFFDPAAKLTVSQYGIELYPGYVTSIRQHERDVLMCAELTHRVMRTDTCYTIMKQCMMHGGNWKDNFKRMVLGSVVMTTYGKNRTYTVNDVEYNTTAESNFQTSSGNTTFVQYFKERYNIIIRDPRQPMLVSRSKPRDIRAGLPELIYLVPELVRATGITDDMRRNFNLMRTLADHTRLTPDRRIERLEVFNRRLQDSKESAEVFSFWKTELDRRLVEVPARVLQPETIFFHPEQPNYAVSAGEMAEWQMAFRNNPMYYSVALTQWFAVVPKGSERLITDFMQCLRQAARGMRFQIEEPQIVVIPNDSPAVYIDSLNSIVQRDPQMIMCLVTNDKADRYAAIKKKCCVDRAVATQVIKTRTITPKGGNVRTLMSVATKVAIQVNCKLGGIPWILKNPLSSIMVIGYDVCHDTRDKSKSYGALVASMYGAGCRHPKYFSTVNHHSNGEELSNFMAQNIIKALHSYRADFGNALPDRIIVYRDGVGDGQLKHVYEHEVNSIKDNLLLACKAQPNSPKLTFFVVNKRINTRLFHQKRNPVPGTIVDDVITLPERNDFYLVSQSVRQGTVSPTSYNILKDESGLSADKLQLYTFKQTHMYYNWSGTVGVPAVCQYAHKLAALAGQYLHQAPNNLLEKKLYYL